ncbi:MAG TPA: aminomethyl-transferring glycine dehydrogenase subunit GcvPA [Actinomycetota bacterium]|nr:aminomethyl-transferring glycine dehydrogenase subunit GcvPA [Actinomycetota bacterium]
MDYTPHTQQDVDEMLQVIGVDSVDALFDPIPKGLRLGRPLDIPAPMTESEVITLLSDLAGRNNGTESLRCFAGGGAYDHYIPAPVRALAFRSEFATSYTPYQPELSQGVLGALYEYQTMICELTGMEVSNASLYDGASALVEAVNLATAQTGRSRVIISEAINPNYRAVIETFGRALGYEFVTAKASGGITEWGDVTDAACLIAGQPNFFGCIEDLKQAADRIHGAGGLLIVHYDPLAAGVIEAPGVLGADVVTGEGQCLGNDLNFGGPYLGIFATKMEFVRRVPGRICGATLDVHGKPGFVLTLQAREQHIRREKANSNVCTNQTLMAVVATVYMSWLGPRGLEELGETCAARTAHAAQLLASVPGCSLKFDAPFFKEFVLQLPIKGADAVKALSAKGFLAGPSLESVSPDLTDCIVVAVTEKRSPEEIEGLAKALAEVVA